ncbi:MAG: TldD/PmbA family protein [Rhodospirillales bacterium]
MDALNILTDLIAAAKRAGADEADAVLFEAASIAVAQRLGALEKLERSEGCDLGLRVFVGKRQAIVSSTDLGAPALKELVERAVAMAKVAPEDPYCGIAEAAQLAASVPDLDIFDPSEPTSEQLIEMTRIAEDAARSVPGVTNSEGAEAGWSHAQIALAASNGFARGYALSSHSISASVLAGEGTAMERDYDFATAVYAADLAAPEAVGRGAGERAVRRLGARKMKTCQVPVVYDPRVSSGLVRHFAGAINGAAIARGTSFLKDRMGEAVFAPGITIVDDPRRRRGLRSKPFDGEGVATTARNLIDDGRLTTWVLDLAAARKLGLATTGHAARGTASPPSPATTNLYMQNGTMTPAALMADIKDGFYVTELIGMGVNGITGDYSRGASGFWIENGALAFPVSELTVAGNLKEMFRRLTPANDLEFKFGVDAPTIRVDGMTVAGM